MGIELFGATHAVYIAVACFVSYLCSGHSGIYLSQRIAVPKTANGLLPPEISLRHAREIGPSSFDQAFGPLFAIVALPRLTPTRSPSQPCPTHITSPRPRLAWSASISNPRSGTAKTGVGRLKAAFSGRALYQELVLQAKRAGLVNAVAHTIPINGFSNHGQVQQHETESINAELTMCVELVAPRVQLEKFCREHGAMLKDKIIVYKHLEHWKVGVGEDSLLTEQVDDEARAKRHRGITGVPPGPASVPFERLRVIALRTLHAGPFEFVLAPGDCLAITGPSGAGKSLLLRMIADLDPHEGEILLDCRSSVSMSGPEWRSKVVYSAAESGWWARPGRRALP